MRRTLTVAWPVGLLLAACTPADSPTAPAMCGPFEPSGAYVSRPDHCPEEVCVVLCAGDWCGADTGGFYCEDCASWEAFATEGACASCVRMERGGAETLYCHASL